MGVSGGMYTDKYRSWMLFVDGENFTIRAQDYLRSQGRTIAESVYYKRDCFIWLPGCPARQSLFVSQTILTPWSERAYYYTSLKCDEPALRTVTKQLWGHGFSPSVFKKVRKEEKAKGVDIALTKDMLVHAFHDHYDVAVLLAGDGDYVPLVDCVKRYGKWVLCAFFEGVGLSEDLKLAADEFCDITPIFMKRWHDEQERLGKASAP
jgi:uncharacterized LabA/DUF88 family protein